MSRFRKATSLLLVALLLLALPGCVSPPEWSCFDVEGHPAGAYPAQTGYYAGAYVGYPATIVVLNMVAAIGRIGGGGHSGGIPVSEGGANVFGVLFGVVLGAPFHLLAFPFEGGDDEDFEYEEPEIAPMPVEEGGA